MNISVALAPLVCIVGALLLLFGSPQSQKLAPAMFWLGLAFVLAQYAGSHGLSLH